MEKFTGVRHEISPERLLESIEEQDYEPRFFERIPYEGNSSGDFFIVYARKKEDK